MNKGLLFLCHRIPYPPNKGDKIRSFHILKHLAKKYDIHLAAFVDDPEDWKYTEEIDKLCVSSCFKGLDPLKSKIKSLLGFIRRQPLTLPYYFDPGMASWVERTIAEKQIKSVFVYSSAMAQYVMYKPNDISRKIIDFVDVDSDKWHQYSEKKSWPMSWIYAYESKALFSVEKEIASLFDAGFFVTQQESEMFKTLAPEVSKKIDFFNNGVDTDYFSPGHEYVSPYAEYEQVIVFTGAMDYWANVDAVVWFVKNIFIKLREQRPRLKFYIVGSKPTKDVLRLGNIDGVVVTGTVEDVRPYLHFSSIAVAPMRIARGVQNKVLEAMAMAKVTLTSPQGYEGILARIGREVFVLESSVEWREKLIEIIGSENTEKIGRAARQYILDQHSWENSLLRIDSKLEL